MRVQWKSLALGLVPHGCEDFSTVKKILKPLCTNIKYSSTESSEGRMDCSSHLLSVLHNREVCQQCCPELYLCLYSTGSSFELRYEQNSVGDI